MGATGHLACEQAGRIEEALAAAHESVATLSHDFLAKPQRFGAPMRAQSRSMWRLGRMRGRHGLARADRAGSG
jgi:hypothetical protein